MARTPFQLTSFLGLLAMASSAAAQPAGLEPVTAARSVGATSADSRSGAGDLPRFSSGVDVVALEVCVKGRDGTVVGSLNREDFLVFENGIAQPVSLFVPEGRAPLAVSLLVDHSASMDGERLERAKIAALAFLEMLNPDDLVEVITFNARIARPVALSTNHQEAAAAMRDVVARDATRLFEAIAVGLHDLSRLPAEPDVDYRRAMVVLSDGEDTQSRLAYEDLAEDARRSGVLIYAVSLQTDEEGRWLPAPYHLTGLAHDTGARALSVQDPGSLPVIYKEIAAELRHLYRLGYVSSHGARDGAWRSIVVRVRDRNALVRTRTGYYAPRRPLASLLEGR